MKDVFKLNILSIILVQLPMSSRRLEIGVACYGHKSGQELLLIVQFTVGLGGKKVDLA